MRVGSRHLLWAFSLLGLVGHSTGLDQSELYRRELQSDPCTAAESDAKIFDYAAAPNITFFKPSFFESCLESFVFNDNGTTMMEHVIELYGVFAQYHSFFDVSKDPTASDPLVYQEELGYKVYGEGSGKVDLAAGFESIINEINSTKTASQATFWNISSLINQLRDAHIQLHLSALYPTAAMNLIPDRIIEYSTTGSAKMSPTYTLDEQGQLQLQIGVIYDNGQPDDTLTVATIDGKSVHEFLTALVDNPAVPLGYQSLGARINSLVSFYDPFAFPLGFMPVTGRPTDALPDTLEVAYEDGSTETFHAAVSVDVLSNMWTLDNSTGYSVNRTLFEAIAHQPGDLRAHFNVALTNINGAPVVTAAEALASVSIQGALKQTPIQNRNLQEQEFQFDKVFTGDIDQSNVAAYKIEDGYAVLKVQGFMFTEVLAAQIYLQVAKAAKEAGVKKLMIDVSDNGGGIATSGLTLAHLLFPELDGLTWLRARWQIRYNAQMDSFKNYTMPLLYDIASVLGTGTLSPTFQAMVANTTADAIKNVSTIIDNMPDFCPSQGYACARYLPDLKNAIDAYASAQTSEAFFELLGALMLVLLAINPWTVGLPITWVAEYDFSPLVAFISNMTVVEKNFGGTTSSYTNRFDLTYNRNANSTDSIEGIVALVDAVSVELDGFTFDEYLIVSNGAAGSTTSIFVTAAEQIYKNRDKSGVSQSLTTLAYGGSGNADEIAMTSFPAAIRDVNLDFPLVTYAAISAYEVLVSSNSEYAASVNEARRSYEAVLLPPPYYSSKVPTLPVVTYFDTFMGPESMPMQYIYMPPDVYLPTMYKFVLLYASSDLQALYDSASTYFPSEGGGGNGGTSSAPLGLISITVALTWSIVGLVPT